MDRRSCLALAKCLTERFETVCKQNHLLEHVILTSVYRSLLGRGGRKVKTSPGTFKIELGISL